MDSAASATPRPVTFVTSLAEPPSKDVSTPGGVLRNETLLSALVRDELQGPQAGRGCRDVDQTVEPTPATGGRAAAYLNTTLVLLAMFGRLEVPGGPGVGVLVELESVEAPGSTGPIGRGERLVGVAEVVEGVVDRRGRVADRLQPGVIEARSRSSSCR